MVKAIEIEADAVIENGTPAGRFELAGHQPRQAVVSWPAIQKVTVRHHSQAPRGKEAGGKAALAHGQMNGVQLMPAVAAILLDL